MSYALPQFALSSIDALGAPPPKSIADDQSRCDDDVASFRAVVVSGGGCGKTTNLDKVICSAIHAYLEGSDRATRYHTCASLIRAQTVHTLNGVETGESG